jgi:hypothetical protein
MQIQRKLHHLSAKVITRVKSLGWLYDSSSLERIVGWFSRMNAGNQADFRSPLFSKPKGEGKGLVHAPYSEIVSPWMTILSRRLAKVPSKLRGLIEEMEVAQAKKVGPKSPHESWFKDGPKKVDALFAPKSVGEGFEEAKWDRALERIHSLVPSNSIGLFDVNRAIMGKDPSAGNTYDNDGMDVSTNSGLPNATSPWKPTDGMREDKRLDAELAYEYILRNVTDLIPAMMKGFVPEWRALVGQRLVSVGPDWQDLEGPGRKKKRIIIAIEKSEPVLWKLFSPTLYDAFREVVIGGVKPFMAWIDLPVIDKNCQAMLRNAHQNNLTVVSGDIASFDQSVNPKLLVKFGPIIDSWLKGAGKLGSGLVTAMTSKVNIVAPHRLYRAAPMGMPSGSGGTNIMDSLYNLATLFYGEEKGYYKLMNCAVQGDDFLALGQGCDQESIETTYSEVGMDANKDKQMYEPDALNYLQRIHFRDYLGGIASATRVLGSCLVYERLSYKSHEWNAYVDIVRTLSQLENAAFHPAFEDLVEYVASGDRYHLGAKEPAQQVMKKAGATAKSVLAELQKWTHQSVVEESDEFSSLAVNGVLRGRPLGDPGSSRRFDNVYGDRASRQ